MAWAKKDLNAVNDELRLDNVTAGFASAVLEYPTGGTGTVVVEGSVDKIQWDVLFCINMGTGVGSAAGLAAAGKLQVDVTGLNQVRARKSVTIGACLCSLSISEG